MKCRNGRLSHHHVPQRSPGPPGKVAVRPAHHHCPRNTQFKPSIDFVNVFVESRRRAKQTVTAPKQLTRRRRPAGRLRAPALRCWAVFRIEFHPVLVAAETKQTPPHKSPCRQKTEGRDRLANGTRNAQNNHSVFAWTATI